MHKISEIRASFFKKNKEAFLDYEVDENVNLEEIRTLFKQKSLLSPKKLVIAKNVLNKYPDLLVFLEKEKELLNSQDDFFVFWEADLSENQKALGFFKRNAARIQEVKFKDAANLSKWVEKKSKELGISFSKEERDNLVSLFGNAGEWSLENELEKISLSSASTEKINSGSEAVSPSRFSSNESAVFNYADKIFYNNFSRAALVYKSALLEGVDSMRLFYTICWKLKNIIMVKRGEAHTLSPYVAKKTEAEAKNFSEKKITDAYWSAIETESLLKRDAKKIDENIEKFLFSFN